MQEEGKITAFGKSYNLFGNTSAHLCLSTSGDVMIKTANRYVPIFKNGKLNVDGTSQIFSVSSEDEISKNGIYLVTSQTEDEETESSVYLSIDGQKILLASSGEGYISYTSVQNLSSDEFIKALGNIGFYFSTLDEAKEKFLGEGLVYITSEGALYKASNGTFTKYEAYIESEIESLIQSQEAEPDTLSIGGIFINGLDYIINSGSSLSIQINGVDYIYLANNSIYIRKDVVLQSNVSSRGFSKGNSGFGIYTQNGETYLEVDNLIVHNGYNDSSSSLQTSYVSSDIMNVIRSVEEYEDDDTYYVTLSYQNNFSVGDICLVSISSGNEAYLDSYEEDGVYYITVQLSYVPSEVTVVRVTYMTDDVEYNVNVTIDPNDVDEEGDIYGQAVVGNDPDEFISLTVISGDKSVYYSGGDYNVGTSIPSMKEAIVISIEPTVLQILSLSDSEVSSLVGSVIVKVASDSSSDYVLYLSGNSLSLREYAYNGSDLEFTEHTKMGPESFLSDKIELAQFENNYPTYGASLVAPTDVTDEQYNNCIPSVAWVKALIEALI